MELSDAYWQAEPNEQMWFAGQSRVMACRSSIRLGNCMGFERARPDRFMAEKTTCIHRRYHTTAGAGHFASIGSLGVIPSSLRLL